MRTSSTTSRPAPERRGLTLLELLVVIGIVVVLLGLAVPVVSTALDRRRLASVADEVLGSLLMARAHAQAEGVTVEVILVDVDATASRRADGRTPVRLVAREIDLHAPPYDDEDGPPPLRRTWADLIIEWPLRVAIVGADADGDDGAADSTASDRPAHGASASRRGVWSTNRREVRRDRLAVFAADGSAIVAPRLRVSDAEGRFLYILVNPFTGLPRLEKDLAEMAGRALPERDGEEADPDLSFNRERDGDRDREQEPERTQ